MPTSLRNSTIICNKSVVQISTWLAHGVVGAADAATTPISEDRSMELPVNAQIESYEVVGTGGRRTRDDGHVRCRQGGAHD